MQHNALHYTSNLSQASIAMIPPSRSHRVPSQRSTRTKPKKKPATAKSIKPPMPPISHSSSSSSSLTTNIPKPMRPLTAYHIFFQIEREYIIQTTAGPVADKSIHANKSYLRDVPRRYRRIKLLPDWFAGPGKRRKRKHRKSHGKIGFLELSRVISKRWATLDTTDPETKRYVTMIAARELDGYKIEMNEYKELTKNATTLPTQAQSDVSAAAAATVGAMISPDVSTSQTSYPMDVTSSNVPLMMPQLNQPIQYMTDESPESILSLDQDFATFSSSCDVDEIDYSICSVSNNGNYIPSPGPESNSKVNMIHPDGTICDPLFELDNGYNFNFQQPTMVKRCVSPVSSDMNVGIVRDGDFFQL
mmetsp:Transcript_11209/g.23902  ORF Transcript_11209/g.23902 Transcript_11209/m.23902 type:complete len:361 (-) Transcript_11209:168-1250(-)